MCIKAGENELDSVKALMSMSLKAIVADALEADLDEIEDTSYLADDLHMDEQGKAVLEALIAEYFDGFEIDVATTPTFGQLQQEVVLNEFRDLGDHSDMAA